MYWGFYVNIVAKKEYIRKQLRENYIVIVDQLSVNLFKGDNISKRISSILLGAVN